MAATLGRVAVGGLRRIRRMGPHGAATLISYGLLLLFVVSVWSANQQVRWPWARPNWRVQAYLTLADGRAVDVNDVVFVDASRGWAVGDFGAIWHTRNAGETWVRQASGTRELLRGVDFLDEERGWVVCAVWNRMQDLGDGEVHQAINWSLLKYAGNDQWSYEEDIYRVEEFADMIKGYMAARKEAKSKG